MDAGISLEVLQDTGSAYYQDAKMNAVYGSTGNIRLDAVKEAALGVGIRGGLNARTDEINRTLESVSRQLDVAYDFRPYLLDARVLPPVVVEGHELYTQSDDITLRLAGRSYRIESQARFVSRPPTWRGYLVMKHEMTMPSAQLLPKTDEEKTIWKITVSEGWQQGVEQANEIFRANYDRLHRDYLGMLRFHKLVASKVVTMPIIAQSDWAISGDANEVFVDESLLRITTLPSFNMDIASWEPRPGKVVDQATAEAKARKGKD